MSAQTPNLRQFIELQQQMLNLRLAAVRTAIAHNGEKGDNLEHHAAGFLRQLLPAEYGIGTGFIAYRSGAGAIELSSQLDLIIFDAHRGGPLIDLDTVQVFPLESVYGYVEVKSDLYKRVPELQQQSAAIRTLRRRRYACFVGDKGEPSTVTVEPTAATAAHVSAREILDAGGKHLRFFVPERQLIDFAEYLPIRCFVVAFEYGPTFSAEAAKSRMEDHFVEPAHFHAVLVPNTCCIMSVNAQQNRSLAGKVTVDIENPLATFRRRLLEDLATFPRLPADQVVPVDQYFAAFP